MIGHAVGKDTISGKRLMLLAVAAVLSVAAALAIGILLFGNFGPTEQRILGTTFALGGYGILALPAAILRDQRRLKGLAAVVVVLAVVTAGVAVTSIWWGHEPPVGLGKSVGTGTAWLVVTAQVAALAARRTTRDSRAVRRLYVVSSVVAVVIAGMFTVLIWAQFEGGGFARIFGALIVLDVLLVALQPILSRARPAEIVHRLRVVVASGETVELAVEAPSLAAAAAKAIRTVERDGRRPLRIELDAGSDYSREPESSEKRSSAYGNQPVSV